MIYAAAILAVILLGVWLWAIRDERRERKQQHRIERMLDEYHRRNHQRRNNP